MSWSPIARACGAAVLAAAALSCVAPMSTAEADATADAATVLPWIRVTRAEDRARIEVDGALFTEYRSSGEQRPHFFPVIGPAGHAMTRGFPMEPRAGEADDHPHHQSLWFTHGAVNGANFWAGQGERIRQTSLEELVSGRGSGGFTVRNEWTDETGRIVLRDTRRHRFGATSALRWIDFDVTLSAPAEQDVVFQDTKEGSMAIRVAAELRVQGAVATGSLRNSEGLRDGDCWGRRAAWLHATGLLDGAPAGILILDHPENLRHPTWWHARSYGLLAANPFGVHDFEGKPAGTGDLRLAAGEQLRLRWRFLFHAGELSAEDVRRQAAAFAAGS